jgi:penicillin V acylase-like amidase (Ntn superfamily)
MKKNFIFTLSLLISFFTARACTTFFINHNGQLIFGRNYDWVTDAGLACTNQRGLYKTSFKMADGESISWVAQYGSITFNQYGKEFPTGGMNEKGLVVELMWLDETKYPEADKRPSISVLQWIQYQLDNCASIEEVIATDKKLRITTTSAPLHYLIADANGNAAAIEFLDGKLHVHKGSDLPFPVLTNSTYQESKLTGTPKSSGNYESFQNNSIERFAKACRMVEQFTDNKISTPVVDYAFGILDNVSQGDHTKWSIVYDLKNKIIRFKTKSFITIKSISFSAFDFSCSIASKAFDMNQVGKDDVSKSFKNFTPDLNRGVLEKAIRESAREVPLSENTRETMLAYAEKPRCR